MSTRYTENPRRTLIQEAADPATDTERLRYLAHHKREDVRLAAIQNPGVPEDVWRKALLEGKPEAWSNPMAPIYLLVWSPQPGDWRTLENAARHAMYTVWELKKQVSPDGKSLLNGKILEWWVTSVSAEDMMEFLWNWSHDKYYCEHRDVVRLFVLCVRTLPGLTDKDRQALNLLEDWCNCKDEKIYEAMTLSYSCSHIVRVTIGLASNPSPWSNVRSIISKVNEIVAFRKKGVDLEEAVAEHDRLLADLIRREMPLPPQL